MSLPPSDSISATPSFHPKEVQCHQQRGETIQVMNKVLLVAPLNENGNGGILSWTKKFVKTFNSNEFKLVPVNASLRRSNTSVNPSFIKRIIDGLLDMQSTRNDVINAIKNDDIRIMHTTTSGSLGTLRDYMLAKICKRHGIKTIMHCRYGSMSEDLKSKGFMGCFLVKTLNLYDQIWVLDNRTLKTLQSISAFKDKAFLTPNSIEVPLIYDAKIKKFTKIAFIGNLIPSKGLYELVEAITKVKYDVELSIVGPGTDEVINKIKEIAGYFLNSRIRILGKLPNFEAVTFMKSVDIVALPTYYPSEAFPISILEAMSLGKLVISTHRAAIPDMLTSLDGTKCGILVREKSVDDIIGAIEWCIENPNEANAICLKAYKKVYIAYRTEVVYNIYEKNYMNLI